MKTKPLSFLLFLLVNSCSTLPTKQAEVTAKHATISTSLDGFFYETAAGRQMLPLVPTQNADGSISAQVTMSDGRVVSLSIKPDGQNSEVTLTAQPDSGIV